MNYFEAQKSKVAHLERDFVSASLPPFHVTSASPFKASATPFSAAPFSAPPFSAAPFSTPPFGSSYSNPPIRSLRETQCHVVSGIDPQPARKRHLLNDMFAKGVRA
jgi:hypothetical protein